MNDKENVYWLDEFYERERRLILNCRNYADGDPAGLPGHNLMLIVAKLADLLDARDRGLALLDGSAVE